MEGQGSLETIQSSSTASGAQCDVADDEIICIYSTEEECVMERNQIRVVKLKKKRKTRNIKPIYVSSSEDEDTTTAKELCKDIKERTVEIRSHVHKGYKWHVNRKIKEIIGMAVTVVEKTSGVRFNNHRMIGLPARKKSKKNKNNNNLLALRPKMLTNMQNNANTDENDSTRNIRLRSDTVGETDQSKNNNDFQSFGQKYFDNAGDKDNTISTAFTTNDIVDKDLTNRNDSNKIDTIINDGEVVLVCTKTSSDDMVFGAQTSNQCHKANTLGPKSEFNYIKAGKEHFMRKVSSSHHTINSTDFSTQIDNFINNNQISELNVQSSAVNNFNVEKNISTNKIIDGTVHHNILMPAENKIASKDKIKIITEKVHGNNFNKDIISNEGGNVSSIKGVNGSSELRVNKNPINLQNNLQKTTSPQAVTTFPSKTNIMRNISCTHDTINSTDFSAQIYKFINNNQISDLNIPGSAVNNSNVETNISTEKTEGTEQHKIIISAKNKIAAKEKIIVETEKVNGDNFSKEIISNVGANNSPTKDVNDSSQLRVNNNPTNIHNNSRKITSPKTVTFSPSRTNKSGTINAFNYVKDGKEPLMRNVSHTVNSTDFSKQFDKFINNNQISDLNIQGSAVNNYNVETNVSTDKITERTEHHKIIMPEKNKIIAEEQIKVRTEKVDENNFNRKIISNEEGNISLIKDVNESSQLRVNNNPTNIQNNARKITSPKTVTTSPSGTNKSGILNAFNYVKGGKEPFMRKISDTPHPINSTDFSTQFDKFINNNQISYLNVQGSAVNNPNVETNIPTDGIIEGPGHHKIIIPAQNNISAKEKIKIRAEKIDGNNSNKDINNFSQLRINNNPTNIQNNARKTVTGVPTRKTNHYSKSRKRISKIPNSTFLKSCVGAISGPQTPNLHQFHKADTFSTRAPYNNFASKEHFMNQMSSIHHSSNSKSCSTQMNNFTDSAINNNNIGRFNVDKNIADIEKVKVRSKQFDRDNLNRDEIRYVDGRISITDRNEFSQNNPINIQNVQKTASPKTSMALPSRITNYSNTHKNISNIPNSTFLENVPASTFKNYQYDNNYPYQYNYPTDCRNKYQDNNSSFWGNRYMTPREPKRKYNFRNNYQPYLPYCNQIFGNLHMPKLPPGFRIPKIQPKNDVSHQNGPSNDINSNGNSVKHPMEYVINYASGPTNNNANKESGSSQEVDKTTPQDLSKSRRAQPRNRNK